MINYKVIGNRIRKLRKAENITQEVMAEKLDISINYYSSIERAAAHPNLARIAQIAEILDTELEYLICGVNTASPVHMKNEFNEIIEACNPEQMEAIYKMAKIISQL